MAVTASSRKLISNIIIALSFIVGLALLIRLWQKHGSSLLATQLTLNEILLIMLVPLAMFVVIVARSYTILKAFDTRASLGPLSAITLATQAVGQLLPGGVITELTFRTFAFSRAGLDLNTSIKVNAVDGFIRFAANSIALFLSAVYFIFIDFFDDAARTVVVAGFILSLLGLFILLAVLFGGVDKWLDKMSQRLSSQQLSISKPFKFVDVFRQHQQKILTAFLLSIVGFILEPLQIWIIVLSAGFELPFWAIFWLTQAVNLPRSLPVPGGLGVIEEASVQFSTLIGEAGSVGFATSIIWRFRMLPYIVLGLFLIPFLGYARLIHPDKSAVK